MKKTLMTLGRYGNRYIQEHLGTWIRKKNAMEKDWFTALDFFLSRVYYQGRHDELSDQYYEAAKKALNLYFGVDPVKRDKKYDKAWHNKLIPHRIEWERLSKRNNPLWKGLVAEGAGKERDMEMVLDILRFIHDCPTKNIVSYSLAQISAGEMTNLYDDLKTIYQIGNKVASFFLRDLAFIYDLRLSAGDCRYPRASPWHLLKIKLRLS